MNDTHEGVAIELCQHQPEWNTHPCTNPADVIINGIAICAECAIRLTPRQRF